jgi:HSP20 family protein
MLTALSTRRSALPMMSAPTVFRREVDDLFDRFFGDLAGNGNSGMTRGWKAPVAIWDDEQHVYVEVEIPGVCRDDLELVIHQGSLRIWGERKFAEENRNYWYNERAYGRFERLIALPDTVDADSIEAELHDGILSVQLTKKPEAQPKKVAIKAG